MNSIESFSPTKEGPGDLVKKRHMSTPTRHHRVSQVSRTKLGVCAGNISHLKGNSHSPELHQTPSIPLVPGTLCDRPGRFKLKSGPALTDGSLTSPSTDMASPDINPTAHSTTVEDLAVMLPNVDEVIGKEATKMPYDVIGKEVIKMRSSLQKEPTSLYEESTKRKS